MPTPPASNDDTLGTPPPSPKTSGRSLTPTSESSAVLMQKVSVNRGKIRILANINFNIPTGSSCVILGPNGSGKTTLMRVITGFMWPTTGTVHVLSHQLGRVDMRALRKRISLVDPAATFGVDESLSALNVVLTGYFATLALYDDTTSEQRDHAAHLLDTVGLSHRRDQKFALLSTGEKRRTLLARALVHLPDLLILDEPTAGLDLSGREHVLATIELLKEQHPNLTTIMITHHVEEISPTTSQLLLLKQGRIHTAGHPSKIITPETLTDVFDTKVFVQKRSNRYWLEVLPEAWLELLKQK